MKFISWRKVESWKCVSCGLCCRSYDISLEKNEYEKIYILFGSEIFNYNKYPIKYFLKRTISGNCIFQETSDGKSKCKIHQIKPIICKIFPFLILKSNNKRLFYLYRKKRYNIYLERKCKGIKIGNPSNEFIHETLPKIINFITNPILK
ncbi:MAG: YkgJ family cysteine cluster protein [Candidatus Hodarchaeota archaeon]